MDPLFQTYPYKTPYDFAENDVIRCVDLDGGEKKESQSWWSQFYYKYLDESMAGKGRGNAFVGSHDPGNLGGWGGNKSAEIKGGAAAIGGVLAVPIIATAAPVITVTTARFTLWAASNTETVYFLGGFGAGLSTDAPDDFFPGSGDELAKLIKKPIAEFGGGVTKYANVVLGKDFSGKLKGQAEKFAANYFGNWAVPYGVKGLTFSSQFFKVLDQVVEQKGKIVFDLDKVNINAAKKGVGSFAEAASNKQATEWELNQILNNNDYFNSTIFHLNGKTVSGEELKKMGIENLDHK